MIRENGLKATILRPWYVLGPGHWWPYSLVPVYWILEHLPWTAPGARRLGLVTLPQMIGALVRAVETPATEVRIWDVATIRGAAMLPIPTQGAFV
jgi:nucleoside-diphosphate-sugar epimerase